MKKLRNKHFSKRIRGIKNSTNYIIYSTWPIETHVQKLELSESKSSHIFIPTLEESIVLCNLPMMVGHRFDADIITKYDRYINGYKNWKDFCKRSMKFFTGNEIILNEYEILSNFIFKLFNRLRIESIKFSKGDYIGICEWLSKSFRLYHMKNYDKSKLYDLMHKSSYYSEEIERLINILSLFKSWHCQFLNEVLLEDLSERYYYIKTNRKPIEYIFKN